MHFWSPNVGVPGACFSFEMLVLRVPSCRFVLCIFGVPVCDVHFLRAPVCATSPQVTPATKSDAPTSPNVAPATKSDTATSPNVAPATERKLAFAKKSEI